MWWSASRILGHGTWPKISPSGLGPTNLSLCLPNLMANRELRVGKGSAGTVHPSEDIPSFHPFPFPSSLPFFPFPSVFGHWPLIPILPLIEEGLGHWRDGGRGGNWTRNCAILAGQMKETGDQRAMVASKREIKEENGRDGREWTKRREKIERGGGRGG